MNPHLRPLLISTLLALATVGTALAQGSPCDTDYTAPGCVGSPVTAGTPADLREGEGPDQGDDAPAIPETPLPEDPAPTEDVQS